MDSVRALQCTFSLQDLILSKIEVGKCTRKGLQWRFRVGHQPYNTKLGRDKWLYPKGPKDLIIRYSVLG